MTHALTFYRQAAVHQELEAMAAQTSHGREVSLERIRLGRIVRVP